MGEIKGGEGKGRGERGEEKGRKGRGKGEGRSPPLFGPK